MKQLVKHLVDNHIEEITQKSFLNCHTKGLHSIMLLDVPEKRIRLFISEPNSEMSKNTVENFVDGVPLSIAFHSHHCDITIRSIFGVIKNWKVCEISSEEQTGDNHLVRPKHVDSKISLIDDIEVFKYAYKSAILDGEMKFEKQCSAKLRTVSVVSLYPGISIPMKANEIHTVSTDKNRICAWFVYEGKENSNYEKVCFSNSDPNISEFKNELYKKPTTEDVLGLLKMVHLLN